jgi:hypothetical protein
VKKKMGREQIQKLFKKKVKKKMGREQIQKLFKKKVKKKMGGTFPSGEAYD